MPSFARLSAVLVCLISASPALAQSGNIATPAGDTASRTPEPGVGPSARPTIPPYPIGDTAAADLVRRTPETRPEPALSLPAPGAAALAGRYAAWGAVAGGAIGLAYGLTEDDDALGLSPVLEMGIGAGAGFFLGLAVDVVRRLR